MRRKSERSVLRQRLDVLYKRSFACSKSLSPCQTIIQLQRHTLVANRDFPVNRHDITVVGAHHHYYRHHHHRHHSYYSAMALIIME